MEWIALVITVAIIFIWHGTIGFIKMFFFPGDKLISSIMSWVVGLGILWYLGETKRLMPNAEREKIIERLP